MYRIRIGLMAGLIAVVTTTLVNLLSRAIGLLPESMDLRHLAEFLLDTLDNPAGALILGIVIHVIGGGLVGMIYALLVRSYTPQSGVLFMVAFWLLMMLAVTLLLPQGFFGLGFGLIFPIATFALNVIFGEVMGLSAGKMNVR
jgi:Family of unknown function (DUF6789)